MLVPRLAASAAVLAALLAACGTQSARDDRLGAADALATCRHQLLGDTGYSDVWAANQVSGADMKDWLETRSGEGGPYSSSQLAAIKDAEAIIVCGMADPHAAPPGPLGRPPADSAIVWLRDGAAPQVDTLGDRKSLQELLQKLG